MANNILDEFLVAIGFKVDDNGKRKFLDALRRVEIQAHITSDAIEALARKTVDFSRRISSGLEDLYYAAQRTGASAAEIKTFSYAISQMGGTAEGARSSLENFARKLRENPNYSTWLRNFGVTSQDPVKAFQQLGKLFADLQKRGQYFRAIQISEMLGIDENSMRAMIENVGKFSTEYAEKLKAVGLDPATAAENGKRLAQTWRSFASTFEAIADKIGSDISGKLTGPLNDFNTFLLKNAGKISDAFITIANAVLDLATRFTGWVASDDFKKILDTVLSAKLWNEIADDVQRVANALGSVVDKLKSIKHFSDGLDHMSRKVDEAIFGKRAAEWFWGPQGGGDSAPAPPVGAGVGIRRGRGAPGDDGGGNIFQRGYHWARQKLGLEPASTKTSVDTGGSSAGSLTALLDEESKRAGIDPAILRGIRAGESLHQNYYDIGDRHNGPAYGPLQLNVGPGRLGDKFQRDTGLDLQDPKTIPAQVRWVAAYIARRLKANPNYDPGREWFGYHPRDAYTAKGTTGEAGYVPDKPQSARVSKTPPSPSSVARVPVAPAPSTQSGGGFMSLGLGPDGRPVKRSPTGGAGFDPQAMRALFEHPALGSQTNDNSSRHVNINNNQSITVHGSNDAERHSRLLGAKNREWAAFTDQNVRSALG